ncbi:SAG family member [Eimeria mitis]|uniref:SAG family member n=1 Tax=Eimeria mitis TaxID=44415 RepID=U6KFR6_9EIME|nr:SAG family member [Eimeria mitis]CDJ34318.1 SAG family member [Eimeria mitis]
MLFTGQRFVPVEGQSDKAVCLAEINGAREAAGLPHFTAAENKEIWPGTEEGDNTHWDPVCEALIAKDAEGAKVEKTSANGFKSGTYAFMALESDTPDCTAAVDHWKDAVSNFTSVPPPKTGEEEPYDKQHNISFVAMFNPSENASSASVVAPNLLVFAIAAIGLAAL